MLLSDHLLTYGKGPSPFRWSDWYEGRVIISFVKIFKQSKTWFWMRSCAIWLVCKWLTCSSIILLFNLPIGYFLFSMGYEAYWIIVCFIATSVLYRTFSLYLMNRLLDFEVKKYVINAYLRPLLVICILSFLCVIYKRVELFYSLPNILGIITFPFLSIFLVFMMGFNGNERKIMLDMLAKKS